MGERIITESEIQGDLITSDDLVFENIVTITGHLNANSVHAKQSIYVGKSYVVRRNDKVGGSQTVGWSQEVGEYQEVGGYQKVGEYQEVGGYQEVGEYQKVGEYQEVGGYQEVGEYQKVGEYQEVGEYNNPSFTLLDLDKIKTKRITFAPSYYHERNFWLAQLSSIGDIEEVKEAIHDKVKCWEEIIEIAAEHKDKLLAYPYFLPAVRQAIEVMLETKKSKLKGE